MTSWTASTWGVNLSLEWEDPDLDGPLHALKLPTWTPWRDSVEQHGHFKVTKAEDGTLAVDGPGLGSATTKTGLVEALERRMHLFLASQSDQVAYVHAGVIELDGYAVVFPGRSFAGKTTLVLELLKMGVGFLSDEYAIIDPRGRVHPFPRPLSVRLEQGSQRVSFAVSPKTTGGLPLAAVVSCPFQAQASWDPSVQGGSGQAVLEMLANTVSAREQPRLAMTCLSNAVRAAVFWPSPRGPVEEAAPAILASLLTLTSPRSSLDHEKRTTRRRPKGSL